MKPSEFTVEHLKQLPLRAIVAFAARCARRVQPLALLPEGHPERERLHDAMEAALRITEEFAGGSTAPIPESAVAALDASRSAAGASLRSAEAAGAVAEALHATESAWSLIGPRESAKDQLPELKTPDARKFLGALDVVSADLAALNAFTAAVEAYDSVGYRNEDFVTAALDDYDRLVRLKLGRYPEPGDPIDPSPAGPLGAL